MKHKFLTLALSVAFASTMLFSCSNAEEPNTPPTNELNNSDLVEYAISVDIPDEMRTRDAATASIGESGLYEFENRTIDKLWYAIYYNGTLKTSGVTLREDVNPFKLSYSASSDTDPSKLYFFFWAGNSDDLIATNTSNKDLEINDSKLIALNFTNKNVEVNHTLFNQENFKNYDSFAGYFQFTDNSLDTNRSKSFILKRPFSEIHCLTDDFQVTDLKDQFTSGSYCFAGFTTSKMSKYTEIQYMPNKWNYENSTLESNNTNLSSSKPNGFGYFFNDLNNTISSVFYKNRTFDYLSCFYIFTPIPYKEFDYLNFIITNSRSQYVAFQTNYIYPIQLPEEGIKPNTKYVIITSLYDKYEILVDEDQSWDGTQDI